MKKKNHNYLTKGGKWLYYSAKWLLLSSVLTLTLFCFSLENVYGQSDGKPRGCNLGYTRYESENAAAGNGGSIGGGAVLQQSLLFNQADIASEASNQAYVSLPSNGSYVQWTTTAAAQGFDMRFTMPDNTSGTGQYGYLGIYVNGTKVKAAAVSSHWAYQYFATGGSDPTQTPNTKTFMRFDEVHFLLPSVVALGSTIKVQNDNGDGITYGVDFIELEPVPAALGAPANSLSVTDYGAVANDQTDDLAAFTACLAAAATQGKNVYVPAGTFYLSDRLTFNNTNMIFQGAGEWYTTIYFSTDAQFMGGFYSRCSGVEISNFTMLTANIDRLSYGKTGTHNVSDPYKIYKGFMGTYGSNSKIHDVWAEHFECGAWIAGYDAPYPIDITQNLVISNCRFRNNYADGVNFCQGTSNSTVTNCSIRNEGDDGLAMWANNALSAPTELNNTFSNNTIEDTWRAGGIAIFGGSGHSINHNIVKDGVAGSGYRATNDFSGWTFDASGAIIVVAENTFTNCGTSKDLWDQKRGVIEINAATGVFNMRFDNNNIVNAQRDGVQLYGTNVNLNFNYTTIDGTGKDGTLRDVGADVYPGFGIMAQCGSVQATFNYLTVLNSASGVSLNRNTAFTLNIINATVPVSSVSISPTTAVALTVGQTAQLTAVIVPSDATNLNVTWTTSNSAIASVSTSGLVTAVGVGTANITVTTADGGKTATKSVSVAAAVNITATDAAAGEGGNPGVFTIASSSALTSNVTVTYTISGTASTADYTPTLSGSVTLGPSAQSATITIMPVDDAIFEGTETLILTLQPGTGYNLGGSTSATVSIADNDNPPCTAPVVALTSTAPVIDQTVDAAWSIAPTMAINNVTIGAKPADYAGKWRAMYDATNLYILVEVTDATKYNDSGTTWWDDDVIEVFIDGDNSKGTAYDHVNDFQLGFRWNDAAINIGSNSVTNTTGIQFAIQNPSGGYNLEAKIPWSTIGVTPAIGKAIGLEIEVDDDDNGGTRDDQTAAFATTTDAWSNPSVFGTVYLTTCGSTIPVTGVTMSPTSASISVGGTQQLTATVAPTNATNKTVTWSTSNSSIATVSTSGLVTGVASGSATITVTTQDQSKTATCAVTVTSSTVPVTGVTMSPTSATLTVGGTQQLTATIAPTNATNKSVTWSTSNSAIATVSTSGLVTAVLSGSATITVTTVDGSKTATCGVTVTGGISLPSPWASSDIGTVSAAGSASYSGSTFTVAGSGADIWDVADGFRYVYQQVTGDVTITARVASQSNSNGWAKAGVMIRDGLSAGAVHGISAVTPSNGIVFQYRTATGGTSTNVGGPSGTAPYWVRLQRVGSTITAYASVDGSSWTTIGSQSLTMTTVYVGLAVTSHADGTLSTATFDNVTVTTTTTVPVTGVTMSPTTASIVVGGTTQLTATVAPTNATNKTVSWSTSNSAIATVSTSGLVTGVASGSATITVTTQDQAKTATCAVTVTPNTVPVTGVTMSPTTASISVGGTTQLTATIAPTNATNKSVTWSTSSSTIATVSTNGLVTAIASGSATITVTTADGAKTATCAVTVTNVIVTGVTMSPTTAALNVGGTQQLTATIAPTNATNKTVTWSTSNAAIATVSTSGLVTAVASGSATITVTTQDQAKTATCAVTVSAIACANQQGSVTCYKSASAITVNGNLNEASWCISNAVTKTTIGTPNNTVTFGVLWDNTNLYVGVKVLDANLYSSQPDVWNADAVEIYFDGANNGGTAYDANDRQYIITWNKTAVWEQHSYLTGVVAAQMNITGGYSVEFAIPWSNLGITPVNNLTIGFDLGNDDDDTGGGRANQSVWNGTINNYNNPSGFGKLVVSTTVKSDEEQQSTEQITNEVSYMPNPVNDVLNVLFNGNSFTTLSVYDISGRLFINMDLNSDDTQTSVDMSALKQGMYIFRLSNDSSTKVFKVIKQ